MDANISDTLIETLKNQYKQQRRWGYGAENIPLSSNNDPILVFIEGISVKYFEHVLMI